MKKALSILLLILFTFKIVEPFTIAYDVFALNLDSLPTINNSEETIKVHFPMPYVSYWYDTGNEENVVKDQWGNVYQIKNKSYQNDTLYVNLTPDVNSRESFSQLSNLVKNISSKDENSENSNKNAWSWQDILKFNHPEQKIHIVKVAKVALPFQYAVTFSSELYLSQSYSGQIYSPPERVI